MTKDTIFSLKLTKEQKKRIEEVAKKERRSKSSVISNLIDDYLMSENTNKKAG